VLLTATEAYQLLIEIAQHLENEGFRPTGGNVEDAEDYDAKVGYLVAKWVITSQASQQDVFMLANLLFTHCGYDAIRRFCDDVKAKGFEVPYDFHSSSNNFVLHGHPGLDLIGLMDVYDLAGRGRQLGWQRNWCPFRHAAERLWYAGWDGVDRNRADIVAATNTMVELVTSLGLCDREWLDRIEGIDRQA
jgi:hypothetical protein